MCMREYGLESNEASVDSPNQSLHRLYSIWMELARTMTSCVVACQMAQAPVVHSRTRACLAPLLHFK